MTRHLVEKDQAASRWTDASSCIVFCQQVSKQYKLMHRVNPNQTFECTAPLSSGTKLNKWNWIERDLPRSEGKI